MKKHQTIYITMVGVVKIGKTLVTIKQLNRMNIKRPKAEMKEKTQTPIYQW